MSDDWTGVVRLEGGLPAITFRRRYGTDVDDLWSAVTEPERLGRWLATVTGDLRPGGDVVVTFDDGSDPDQRTTGRILACEPPSVLEVEWGIPGEAESVVRVELADVDGGAELRLDHRRLPARQAAGYGAGWHCHLDTLDAYLRGVEPPDWGARWSALLPDYTERLASA
ncbi:MAG: SRPBCC family protein [Actinomycetota bacterium]